MSETSQAQATTTSSDASAPVETGSQGNESQNAETKTPAQVQSLKEKFKLSVDGEEFEEEIDFSNKEDLKKRFQLAAAAKKRMSEAASERKKAFEIIKAFEENPESMLSRLGPKGREIAEKFLLGQIQEDMLSPEEKEMRMTKAELQKYKEQEAKQKEHQEKSAQDKLEFEYAQKAQSTIIEALEKSGMPKTPNHIKNLARLLHQNLELGLDLTAQDLADEWAKERSKDYSSEFKDMSAEQFIKLYGPEMAKRLRMHDLKVLQEKQSSVFQRGSSPQVSQSPKPDKGYETMDEFRERINNRIKQ